MKKSIGPRDLIFPNPAVVVGTYDEKGVANMIAIAWTGIASSDPASIAIAVRPSRYSHANILHRKAFTVNLPSAAYLDETDYFGIVSGRDTDKLADTGLTAVKGEFVDAPYIEEFPYIVECELSHHLDLGAHTLFIGAIRDIRVDEVIMDEKGTIAWEKAGILTYEGSGRQYLLPGAPAGKAFSAGLRFKK